jgi:hypothetical protein
MKFIYNCFRESCILKLLNVCQIFGALLSRFPADRTVCSLDFTTNIFVASSDPTVYRVDLKLLRAPRVQYLYLFVSTISIDINIAWKQVSTYLEMGVNGCPSLVAAH